ncbi:MAG: DUF805 domain-containing protein [Treponema sp.]|nr:DUF805 domain-containing protein [Treponema sp.]MBR0487950.1 DUF805 domain-containing protein [Treponema sp.]
MKNKIRIFDYAGKAARKEYWISFAVYAVFFLVRFAVVMIIPYSRRYDLWHAFTLVLDVLFILNLFSIHIRLINAAGKPLWSFFIPFYRLYFLFCKPNVNKTENKRRFWLIPVLLLMAVFSGSLNFIVHFVAEEIAYDSIVDVANVRKKNWEKRTEETRKLEEEIASRIPANVIEGLNDENYQYAFNLEELGNFIADNYDSESPDGTKKLYKENVMYVQSPFLVEIVNNELMDDFPIRIGDTVEDLYNTFGALSYRIVKPGYVVEYGFVQEVSPVYKVSYSVEFKIEDGIITSISCLLEEF